jgi:predicted Zn-dependent protease
MPLRAFEALDRFLAKEPDHPRGRVLRARALVKLGKRREAVGEFTRAIDQTPAGGLPEPEYYLERAQALGAEGGEYAKEALGGLDEGLARLGPVVTLQLCAIDLEMARNRYDAALERLEKLAAQSARKESYLARRGEILEKAGKLGEARQANVKALEALESLPPHKRKTRAMERLRGRLAQAIERLGRGHGVGQVKETKGTEIH